MQRLAELLGTQLPLRAQILFSLSTTCTGIRIVRALSASARATAWRIHHVAYVETLSPCGSRTSPPRGQDRSFPPGSDRGTQPLVSVALRDRDDEAEVGRVHLPLRTLVASLDPLGELDLLGGGEQLDPPISFKKLERVDRDLAGFGDRRLFLLHIVDDNDDTLIWSSSCPPVDLVDPEPIELELVECARAISSWLTEAGCLGPASSRSGLLLFSEDATTLAEPPRSTTPLTRFPSPALKMPHYACSGGCCAIGRPPIVPILGSSVR